MVPSSVFFLPHICNYIIEPYNRDICIYCRCVTASPYSIGADFAGATGASAPAQFLQRGLSPLTYDAFCNLYSFFSSVKVGLTNQKNALYRPSRVGQGQLQFKRARQPMCPVYPPLYTLIGQHCLQFIQGNDIRRNAFSIERKK
jgi:hypothetical protein